MIRDVVGWISASATMLLIGCVPGQVTTVTIYETPSAYVRLDTDRTVEEDHGHAHPASLSSEQMAAVLGGVVFEEPWAKLPLYDDRSQPKRHPAFTEREIALFSPLLALALSKATPEEVVTFYETRSVSGTSREVTSGGVFVEGNDLHLILGNYRSPTHFSADIGVAETTDDRLTPLRPLAPQRGRFEFEPREAGGTLSRSGMAGWFQADRREVVIRYKQLTPRPVSQTPASPRPR